MKCPYKNFEDCLIEKCPACTYEKKEYTKKEVIGVPPYLSLEEAEKHGYRPRTIEKVDTVYEFVECKLVKNNVQPTPHKTENTVNEHKTNITIHQSLF